MVCIQNNDCGDAQCCHGGVCVDSAECAQGLITATTGGAVVAGSERMSNANYVLTAKVGTLGAIQETRNSQYTLRTSLQPLGQE